MSETKQNRVLIFRIMQMLLVSELGVDPGIIRPEADLVDDLYLDSIDLFNLFVLLSNTFDVDIDPEHLLESRTLSDTAEIIERLLLVSPRYVN